MYKDLTKQREANRKAQAKFKAKTKGITEQGITDRVLPQDESYSGQVFKREQEIAKPERTAQGNIRVSKPGEADYEPQCETGVTGSCCVDHEHKTLQVILLSLSEARTSSASPTCRLTYSGLST